MSAACGAGTEKQRGTRVRPGAPADGRPTTPSLRDCLWTPATNAWPVTSVWAHGGASTAAVNHTNLAENYGTLCRRRSSAQPAQMQLLAPRLLEAASSTRRPRGKYRGKLRRRRLSALPAMVCSPGTSCVLHGSASSAPANSPPPPHPLHLRPGLAAARGRDRGVAGGLSLADRRSVTRRMCRI